MNEQENTAMTTCIALSLSKRWKFLRSQFGIVAFALVFGILSFCGCRPVDGQIFIVTQSRANIKMGLVQVHVVSDKKLREIATDLHNRYRRAELEYRNRRAQSIADSTALSDFKREIPSLTPGALRVDAIAKIEQNTVELYDRVERDGSEKSDPLLDPERLSDAFFSMLPPAAGRTDADGHFSLHAGAQDWLLARSERSLGDKTERYVWATSVSGANGPLLLANDSLVQDSLEIFLTLHADRVEKDESIPKRETSESIAAWIKAAREEVVRAYGQKLAEVRQEEEAAKKARETERELKMQREKEEAVAREEEARKAAEIAKQDSLRREQEAALKHAKRLNEIRITRLKRMDTVGKALIYAGVSPLRATSAVLEGGKVVVWGRHYNGLLKPPDFNDVVQVALGGDDFAVGLRSDGTLTIWGYSRWLGDRDDPRFENIVSIAAGAYHLLALKSDGSVVGIGNESLSRGASIPPSGLTSVVAIASSDQHVLALRSDGTLVAWGANFSNECDVPEGLKDVIAIAAGQSHSVALKGDGTVVTWGRKSSGSKQPKNLKSVVAIAAGDGTTVAMRRDGSLVSWGYDDWDFANWVGAHGAIKNAVGYITIGRETCTCGAQFGEFWRWGKKEVIENDPVPKEVREGAAVYATYAGNSFFVAIIRPGHTVVTPSPRQGIMNLK